MNRAYVDSSCLAATLLGEADASAIDLDQFDELWSSNLLEAEVLAVLQREAIDFERETLFAGLRWIFPNRRLGPELDRVFTNGSLRGADAWHLASALLLSPAAEIAFLTLDRRQREVARRLGFDVLPPSG